MCVLALAWNAHPRWRLVAIGNRDEFHQRPAAPLGWWDEAPILAGRDLQSGGTWMGVHERGRFVAVTNLRGHGGPDPEKASRGQLVSDLLTGEGRYAGGDPDRLGDFNPFNLMAVGADGLTFLTNKPGPVRARLGEGIYGLSNGPLDSPWPKVLRLKGALTHWLTEDADDPRTLLGALADDSVPDEGLPAEGPSDMPDPPLAPIFIRGDVYGTRASSVFAVDVSGEGVAIERSFDGEGRQTGTVETAFRWG